MKFYIRSSRYYLAEEMLEHYKDLKEITSMENDKYDSEVVLECSSFDEAINKLYTIMEDNEEGFRIVIEKNEPNWIIELYDYYRE